MNKIGRDPYVQPNVLERFKRAGASPQDEADRVQRYKAQPGRVTQGSKKALNPQSADRAEISENARKLDSLRQTVEAGRKVLDRTPDVRQEKLALVRSRLASGHYDSDQVRQKVAARLGAIMNKLESLD